MVVKDLEPVFRVAFEVSKVIVETVVKLIVGEIKFLVNTLKGIVNFLVAVFSGDWAGAWQALQDIAEGALEFLQGRVEAIVGLVVGIFEAFGVDLPEVLRRTWNAVMTGVTNFGERMGRGFTRIVNAVIGGIEAVPNAWIAALNFMISAWNGLEFSIPSVKIPVIGTVGGGTISTPNIPFLPAVNIPRLQAGGIIPATPGGRLVLAGEGGVTRPSCRSGAEGWAAPSTSRSTTTAGSSADGELGDQIEERIHIAMSRGAFA